MRRLRPDPQILTLILTLAIWLGGNGRVFAEEIGGATAAADSTHGTARALGTGVLAGAASFTAGFFVGALMFNAATDEDTALAAGIILGSTMGSIGLPLGIHHGNGSRGNGLLVVGTSLAVGAAGWAIGLAAGEYLILPLTAVAQVFASLAVEKATTPAVGSPPAVTFGPAAIGGEPGFAIVGRF